MRIRRVCAALTCAVVALGTGSFVGAAGAAGAPPNDKIGHAVDVSALPFSQTVDTTHATTDADDAQVNATCGAPVTNNSVWYTFTAGPSDTLLAVDTTGSDFSSGVIIATGTPGSLTTQACGPISANVATTSGTTYYILAFDDTASGGTLQISIHGPGPAPANDKIGHATSVGALPFSDALDTTGATTSPSDAQANETCGAPVTDNTVWYKYTAGAHDANVFVDASASNYNVGVLVATGTPGSLTNVACGPFAVVTSVTPGTTYYIMVFDFAGGGGGNLQLNIGNAPGVDASIYYSTRVDPAGVVHLKGTYSCTDANFVEVFGSLVEIEGRAVATGQFDTVLKHVVCDGSRQLLRATVVPSSLGFVPGKAAAFTSALACGTVICVQSDKQQVLKLSHTLRGSPTAAPVRSLHTRMSRRSSRQAYGNVVHPTTTRWGR